MASPAGAESLFKGRQIYLSDSDKQVFNVGVKGSTAGYNYVALVEGAKQESISLSDLGYWEKINDPPSFPRPAGLLQIVIIPEGHNHMTAHACLLGILFQFS